LEQSPISSDYTNIHRSTRTAACLGVSSERRQTGWRSHQSDTSLYIQSFVDKIYCSMEFDIRERRRQTAFLLLPWVSLTSTTY